MVGVCSAPLCGKIKPKIKRVQEILEKKQREHDSITNIAHSILLRVISVFFAKSTLISTMHFEETTGSYITIYISK